MFNHKIKSIKSEFRFNFLLLILITIIIFIFFVILGMKQFMLISGSILLLCVFILIIKSINIGCFFKVDLKTGIKLLVNYLKLDSNLIDNHIYFERVINGEIKALVPRYKFSVDENGDIQLIFKNSTKLVGYFENLDLSISLFGFNVIYQYVSVNENYYIFVLQNNNYKSFSFNSLVELIAYQNKFTKKYSLNIDKHNSIKYQHILLTGQTGSGKSYALIYLILQLFYRDVDMNVVDVKHSDISILSKNLNIPYSSSKKDSIDMLQKFKKDMDQRKDDMFSLLSTNIGSDYSDFNMSAHYFIIDEYAALYMMLNKEEKTTFFSLLNEIILQGRQLGFFVILAMQQSNAQLINTNLREQFGFVCVMGSSGKQTYVTAFGPDIAIPHRVLVTGQGWFKSNMVDYISFCSFPELKFNIVQEINNLNIR